MSGRLREYRAIATALVVLAAGCAPLPLVERAIRARGGSVGTVVIAAEAQVRRAYPGVWRSRRVFAAPDRYAWTIYTTGEPLHHLFDGTTVRAFIGGAPIADDTSPTAPLRSQARFVAVSLLDVLRAPGVQVAVLPTDRLPAGVAAGLTVAFPGSTDRYTVLLDSRFLPVRVEGPVDLSPVGHGWLVARQDDFRPVGARLLPHHVVWELDGAELADERADVCARTEALPRDAFDDPARLPDCPAPPR